MVEVDGAGRKEEGPAVGVASRARWSGSIAAEARGVEKPASMGSS